MRTLTLIILLLTTRSSFSQWVTGSTGNGESIDGIDFEGSIGLFTCKDVIFRSTDNGFNWTFVLGDQSQGWFFRDIVFADANTVYSAGNHSMVKSTNGGQTWTNVALPSTSYLWSVAAPSATTVYVGGENSNVYRSGNGGATFADRSNTGLGTNRAMHFLTDNIGVVASSSAIFRTTNGGSTWTQVHSQLGLWDLCFPDAMHGCAVGGSGRISTTSDGGLTWTARVSGSTINLRGVHFYDANHGMAVGSSTILRTTDGGITWFPEPCPVWDLNSVHMLGPNSVFVGSSFGEYGRNGSLPAGIVEHAAPTTLNVYPNPTNGTLFVELPFGTTTTVAEVVFFDALGRQVFQSFVDASSGSTIDVSSLTAGEYNGIVRSKDEFLGRVRVVRLP